MMIGSINKEDKFYVYCHIRKTDGKCFYIGKGTGNRCKDKNMRNEYWNNIVNKHDFEYVILINNISEKKAFELESYFCNKIGYENLCNIRIESGNGGWSHSEETKHKLSILKTGVPNIALRHPKTEEHKQNMRVPKSEEFKDNMRKPKTEEHKQKLRKPKTEEHKQNISLIKKDKPLYRFRKPIIQYDLKGNYITEWGGIIEAQQSLNISRNNCGISNCCKGISKSSRGFIWKFK